MSTLVILPRANADIVDVLEFTREQFGEARYIEYRERDGYRGALRRAHGAMRTLGQDSIALVLPIVDPALVASIHLVGDIR